MANLVFKFNWEHRPYPYNAAQGKLQFMLPFASGIPNLTPDISQVQGAGTAASASLTANQFDRTLGRVLKVGDFGLGVRASLALSGDMDLNTITGEYQVSNASITNAPPSGSAAYVQVNEFGATSSFIRQEWRNIINQRHFFRSKASDNTWTQWGEYRTTLNTTTDANGFIKAASPVVKLFANAIELNEDAKEQPILFERVGTGDYLLKGSLGLAKEGWFIEIPKDANGNTVVAVLYETLENGDISVKTYKRKFDFDLAAVVADLDNPLEIPDERWIDIRLHEEPISEEQLLKEMGDAISETPAEFQPTNLAQAVAAAMDGVDPPGINEQQS